MLAPLQLPPALFMPDLPDFPGSGSSNIFNVYPRVQVSAPSQNDGGRISYGPMRAPVAQYGALNNRCQGGVSVSDSDGNYFGFAGDVAALYMLKAGLNQWQNASRPGTYNTPDDGMWEYCYFNGDIIATNFSDPPQYMTLNASSSFADLPGSPPKGRYMAVVKNSFVVLGNTNDPVNGNMPQRVWWSAAGNAKNGGWPAPGSNEAAQVQSGATDLLGSGGWVQGFATDLVNADAVVFQQYAIRRMQYTGNPVFSFLPLENAQGTPAPYSIVTQGGTAYYWGHGGIDSLDGSQTTHIGANKVDKFIYGEDGAPGDLDKTYFHRVVGGIDYLRHLIMWAYPSRNAANGNPDRILIYNWILNQFSLVVDITCETFMRFLSIGYTLDELYTVLGYTLDDLPASLDSSVWQGGMQQLGLFDSSHTLNFLTGLPLQATIESSEMQPLPGKRMLVTNSRPLVDITSAGSAAAATVAIGHRETQQQSVTYSQEFALNQLGTCPGRASGMYLRAKCVIPAGSSNWSNFTGIEIMGAAQGSR